MKNEWGSNGTILAPFCIYFSYFSYFFCVYVTQFSFLHERNVIFPRVFQVIGTIYLNISEVYRCDIIHMTFHTLFFALPDASYANIR